MKVIVPLAGEQIVGLTRVVVGAVTATAASVTALTVAADTQPVDTSFATTLYEPPAKPEKIALDWKLSPPSMLNW